MKKICDEKFLENFLQMTCGAGGLGRGGGGREEGMCWYLQRKKLTGSKVYIKNKKNQTLKKL